MTSDKIMSVRHSIYFYRAIARMRAINQENGMLYILRLKTVYRIGYVRAAKLFNELVDARVIIDSRTYAKLREKWKPKLFGNIVWRNVSKYRVPKEITKNEVARLKTEKAKGIFPPKRLPRPKVDIGMTMEELDKLFMAELAKS